MHPVGTARTSVVGSAFSGNEPPPTRDSPRASRISALSPHALRRREARREARRLSSSGAAVIIATVGMRFRASCSSRYSRRVASRAARVILSTRRARLSGFRLIFSMIAFVPTIIPACGPPSTLSPEKVTTSAPAATTERTVGSPGSPAAVKSRKLPLPRSSMSGRPCRCAMSASSSTGTSAWKPTTR